MTDTFEEITPEWRTRRLFGGTRFLPIIHQTEAAECGLACVAMISSYHGRHVSLRELRQRHSVSLKGATLAHLIDVAQEQGFSTRAMRLEVNELGRLSLPCILHWDMNHFVVLKRITKRFAVIVDPAIGETRVAPATLDRCFTGVALELARAPDFKPAKAEPPVSLSSLTGNVPGLFRALAVTLGLALILEALSLAFPQFLQIILDQVIADGDSSLLTFLGLSFLALVLVQTTVTALRSWTVVWISTHLGTHWTVNVFRHLIALPASYFAKRHLGDVVSRFGAVSQIQHTLSTRFIEAIIDGLMAAITGVVLALYSLMLAGIIAASLLLYLGLRLLYFKAYRARSLGQIVVQARQQTDFMEAARGVDTIQLFNQVGRRASRFANVTADAMSASVHVQRLSLFFEATQGALIGGEKIVVLWCGAWLALKGTMTAGMLLAFVAYADQFSSRASALINFFLDLRILRLQCERLSDIVHTPTDRLVNTGYVGDIVDTTIRFEDVGFRYSSVDAWVFRHCTFEIKPGESVAFVGPSGCGKTTLARVLVGLLDPVEGSIYVGGVNIRFLGKARLRALLGCVMQDDQLFSGSIADNISFFDDAASLPAIEAAATDAGIHEDIQQMPMGYHTLVGDMGSTLSGGQKQRVALARALYRQPSILVLDEATSHLDVATERAINASLRNKAMTRIAIAHREETILAASRAFDMSSGTTEEIVRRRIVEAV